MARRTGLTDHTLAALQAGTGVTAQNNDTVRLTDVGNAPGEIFYFISEDTTLDDGVYNIEETGQTGRWRRQGSNLLVGNLNVPFSALPDGTEESIDVAVTGALAGEAYVLGVVSGKPSDVEIELDESVNAADTLTFIIKNNSGVTLTADNIVVNVFKVNN